jgi:hypothetical protein
VRVRIHPSAASKFAPVGIHGKMYMFELQDPNTGATLQLSAEIEKDGHEVRMASFFFLPIAQRLRAGVLFK